MSPSPEGTPGPETEDTTEMRPPPGIGRMLRARDYAGVIPQPPPPQRIPPDITIKIMKSLLTTLGLSLLLAAPLAGQEQDNEAKYKAKLAESFVSNIDWVQNLEEAQQQAKDKSMLIYGHFSRSYAP